MIMSSSVNFSQMDVGTNLDNLGKIEESPSPTTAQPYLISHYPNYEQQQMNLSSQMQDIGTLSAQHTSTDISYQNSGLPLDLNSHHHMNYSGDYSSTINPQECYNTVPTTPNQMYIPNLPLEVHKIPPKPFHSNKETNYGLFNVNKDKFNNFHNNFDSNNQQNKPLLNSERKKTLENTVRFIENILILNSTAKNDNNVPTDKNSNPDVDRTTEKPKNSEKDTTELNVSSKNKQNSKSSNSLPTEITTEHKNKSNQLPTTPTSTSTKEHSLSSKSTDSQNFENVMVKEEKPDDEYSIPIEADVSVKIEPVDSFVPNETSDGNDTDNMTPFQCDSNGLPRERIVGNNGNVIPGETSYIAAMDAIKTASKTRQWFECPHCNIYFNHPKRFLIHYKWHSFGLTNEKRMMLAKQREQKKNEIREARVINRMNAKEVKAKGDANATRKDEKQYECKDCNKMFISKGSLKNHRQRTHPTQSRQCKLCGVHVSGWAELRAHVSAHAADGAFPCAHCDKRFSTAHALTKHSATHMEKTVSCPECPKKFGTTMLLRAHQRVHVREKNGVKHTCSQCGKGFRETYNLMVHERTHRNEKPFQCETCKTSFVTNSGLKRHIKVSHNSAKPFECPTCHRSFVTDSIRHRHVLRSHGDPSQFPYHCEVCDCRYMKRKDLNKHVHKMHPKCKTKDSGTSGSSDEEYFDE